MSGSMMVSVSGIRGLVGLDLTPELVARYAAAFGVLVRERHNGPVVVGRDARTSGPMFARAVQAGLQSVGRDVIDCGLVPTPTVQLAVEHHRAAGGIVITASHNPIEWNALKFVGQDGVFLDPEQGARLRALADQPDLPRGSWDGVGEVETDPDATRRHIAAVLALPVVDVERIRGRGFSVALDCVRGAGGTIMPELLSALGCRVVGMNTEPDGRFPRPPEPVPENLSGLGDLVRRSGADLGVAVDPDVDRLALVDERGAPIGEDYTLAFAVRAVLGTAVPPYRPTAVVCNLSTSLVVEDAARDCGAELVRTPVGEAHVARAMASVGAVIGGEGNGGVILRALHLGRDAPLAAALVLHLLAGSGQRVGELVAAAPRYIIVKAKAPRGGDLDAAYRALEDGFKGAQVDRRDGIRFAWPGRWLHVRPSGTEPLVRLIAEAPSEGAARELVGAAQAALGSKERTVTCVA